MAAGCNMVIIMMMMLLLLSCSCSTSVMITAKPIKVPRELLLRLALGLTSEGQYGAPAQAPSWSYGVEGPTEGGHVEGRPVAAGGSGEETQQSARYGAPAKAPSWSNGPWWWTPIFNAPAQPPAGRSYNGGEEPVEAGGGSDVSPSGDESASGPYNAPPAWAPSWSSAGAPGWPFEAGHVLEGKADIGSEASNGADTWSSGPYDAPAPAPSWSYGAGWPIEAGHDERQAGGSDLPSVGADKWTSGPYNAPAQAPGWSYNGADGPVEAGHVPSAEQTWSPLYNAPAPSGSDASVGVDTGSAAYKASSVEATSVLGSPSVALAGVVPAGSVVSLCQQAVASGQLNFSAPLISTTSDGRKTGASTTQDLQVISIGGCGANSADGVEALVKMATDATSPSSALICPAQDSMKLGCFFFHATGDSKAYNSIFKRTRLGRTRRGHINQRHQKTTFQRPTPKGAKWLHP